jgi:diketogulonate reductase-like aldo/keto reductase
MEDPSKRWSRLRRATAVAARISLAWLVSKPVVTSVIIGAKCLDQLEDNLAAVDLKLSEDEIKQLNEVSASPLDYHGWMIPFQNAHRLEPIHFPLPAAKPNPDQRF